MEISSSFYYEANIIMNKLLSHYVSKLLIEPYWQNIKKKKKTSNSSKKAKSKNFSEIMQNLSLKSYNNKEEWIEDVNYVFDLISKQQKGTYFVDNVNFLKTKFDKYLYKSDLFNTTENWVHRVMHYKLKISHYIQKPPLIQTTIEDIIQKISEIIDNSHNQNILNIIHKYQPELITNNQIETIQLNKLQSETLKALDSYLNQINLSKTNKQ